MGAFLLVPVALALFGRVCNGARLIEKTNAKNVDKNDSDEGASMLVEVDASGAMGWARVASVWMGVRAGVVVCSVS